jgi:hypothetical protein
VRGKDEPFYAIRPCLEGWSSHTDQATGLVVINFR